MKKTGLRNLGRAALAAAVCAALLTFLPAFRQGAFAGEDFESLPFEVKFLLDPEKVLTRENLPTEELKERFALEDCRAMELLYLETPDRAFNQAGWSNRLRWKSWKKKPEYSFKKRYPVADGELSAALAQAAADGLDGAELEIDWGYASMTLSASWEGSEKPGDARSLHQFSTADAIAFTRRVMPAAEADWKYRGWGAETLSRAQKIGPLQVMRAKGAWNEREVTLEILCLPGSEQASAELSLKADGCTAAADIKARLTAELEDAGLLLKRDALKTQNILDAGLPEKESP